jgi:hypothetical protein
MFGRQMLPLGSKRKVDKIHMKNIPKQTNKQTNKQINSK